MILVCHTARLKPTWEILATTSIWAMEWLLLAVLCFQNNPVPQMDSADFRVRQSAQIELEAHRWAYLPRMAATRQYGSPEARARVTAALRHDGEDLVDVGKSLQNILVDLATCYAEYQYRTNHVQMTDLPE